MADSVLKAGGFDKLSASQKRMYENTIDEYNKMDLNDDVKYSLDCLTSQCNI